MLTLSSEIQFHGQRAIQHQREGFKYMSSLSSEPGSLRTKCINHARSDPPQSGERGESVNRDNRISLSDDSAKTDLIFFFRGNVGCQVEQLGPCSIALARTTSP